MYVQSDKVYWRTIIWDAEGGMRESSLFFTKSWSVWNSAFPVLSYQQQHMEFQTPQNLFTLNLLQRLSHFEFQDYCDHYFSH